MRRIISSVFVCCLSLFACWPPGPALRAEEDEGVAKARAKLEAVRKQLEELRQKEQALAEHLEKARREAAKRSEARGYIKAEVKGVLRHEMVFYPAPVGQ